MKSCARRWLSVVLSLSVLLPALTLCLPLVADAAADYGLQTYEAYEAKKHDNVTAATGIAGNGDGREVSGDYNHTPGGSRSVKLLLNGYKSSAETPQTVALGSDGTRLLLQKGKTYTVSVWLYSTTAVSLKYRISSAKSATDVSWGGRQLEKETILDLSAGQWQRIVTDVTLTGISGQETAYLTVGATYADSSVTAVSHVYVDDLQVSEYVEYIPDTQRQTYESYEAKKHDNVTADTGIAGNGDGREVSVDYNHTPGGRKSVKLTMNGYKSSAETPQTVALSPDGTRMLLQKGKTYTVSVWLYSATAVSLKYRISSAKSATDVSWGGRQLEKETVIDLPAGQWQHVVTDVTLTGVSGQETAYLTVGATYANSGITATGYVYVDDVEVKEYIDFSAFDYQTYEGFEAKKYPTADSGIAGNGDGREVSAEQNHTPGGSKSIKLTSKGYQASAPTPQTLVLDTDNNRQTFTKGKSYEVSAWLYSATAVSVKYRIASVKDANDVSWGIRTMEKEVILDLPAEEWTQVTQVVTLNGVSSQDAAYLTLGVTYADSAVTATGYFYVDDVKVTEYIDFSAFDYQTYEGFEAKKYPTADSGIAGNGDGREVSAEQNHTPGGSKSIKLTSKGYQASAPTPQTLVLDTDNSRQLFTKGKSYEVSAWLYSATAVSVKYRIASVKDANDVSWGIRAMEKEVILDLPAGEWIQVTQVVTLNGVSGQDAAYLTLGVTYADSAVTATGYFYVDDVKVTEYIDFSAFDYQTYEGFEAKKYPTADSGIAGNGDGREVSAEQNHTPGGSKSIKLTSKGYQASAPTPQTLVLDTDNNRQTFTKGKSYEVSAWLYSATAVSVKYRIASVKDANDVSWGPRAMEKEVILDLPAGVWTQVAEEITLVGVSGQDTAYMTLGVTYADNAATATTYFYVDDVKVTELPGFTGGKQDYEGYEVGVHTTEGNGIHGNGSGREVSDEQNHTPGGSKSIKLNVNNNLMDFYARTILPLNGADFPVSRGACFTVSFWLYSEKDIRMTWYVGTTVSATNLYLAKNNEEVSGTVELSAGQWTQVTTNLIVNGHEMSNIAYLTVGARFPGCDAEPAALYLDDVELTVPDDLITLTFHAEGGSEVEGRQAFAEMPLGYLASTKKDGYLFGGWYSADGSTLYTSDTVLSAGTTAVDLYARWVAVPSTPQSLTTGFEESEYTAIPYKNDDPATATEQSNMTASAAWLKNAGFNAASGDGSIRLVDNPFVQENGTAYHAVALMNPDGTPFVVKAGGKYRLTYSYRCGEVRSAHSYVGAAVSPDIAGAGFGTGAQKLSRMDVHGIAEDWAQMDEGFVALTDGYLYLTLCARSSTSEASSKDHAVYFDDVTVEALDDTHSGVVFVSDGIIRGTAAGKKGSPLTYPPVPVGSGKELEGFYFDAAFTDKQDVAVFPDTDATLYARFVAADYETDVTYVQERLTLDFEEDFLPTYYSASNHLHTENGQFTLVRGDEDTAHSGSTYLRVNSKQWWYSQSVLGLYSPDTPNNLLYLEPNTSYMVRMYVRMEDDYLPFNAELCTVDPANIITGVDSAAKVTSAVTANEWTQVQGVISTGEQPAVLALRFNTNVAETPNPLVLLDDVTLLKLHEVTVTFDVNGGEKVEPIATTMYSTIEAPVDPYRRDYEFCGWYIDKALTIPFDFATPVEGDMTLYAKWRLRPVDVEPEEETPAPPTKPQQTPSAEPEQETLLDIGDPLTFNPAEEVPPPPADTVAPTPESAFSVHMLLIILAAVVVLVGGGALTVFLLRRKRQPKDKEV